jgi:hypothetical protein
MEASGTARSTNADDAPPGAPGRYERYRPEQTLLYQIIAQHYHAFLAQLAAEGRTLPLFVRRLKQAHIGAAAVAHASPRFDRRWISGAAAGSEALQRRVIRRRHGLCGNCPLRSTRPLFEPLGEPFSVTRRNGIIRMPTQAMTTF